LVAECGDDECGDWNAKSSMLTDGWRGDDAPVAIAISIFQYQCEDPRTVLLLLTGRMVYVQVTDLREPDVA
jgi:hypothetical protein